MASNVVQFPIKDDAALVADLTKLSLSTLYRLRSQALDEGDSEWAALIEEAVRQVYGR
jgi:hypothetical protein